MPRASTIWLFHRGMVFTREDWIFSIISVSLFCKSRVWGPICTDTMRVSSRSCSFFSKRLHRFTRSLYAWASSARPDCSAFFRSSTSSVERTSARRFLPARMYMVSSL